MKSLKRQTIRVNLAFLIGLLSLLSCSNHRTKANLKKVENDFIASVPCRFEYWTATYFCTAHHFQIWDSTTDEYRLVISKDSTNGEMVYSRIFNPDTEQTIYTLQTEVNNIGEYLVVHGYQGKANLITIIAKKAKKIQEVAVLEGQVEFADVDKNGIDEIIVTLDEIRTEYVNGVPGQILPESSSIYSWKGEDLKLMRVVPWAKRLCSIKE